MTTPNNPNPAPVLATESDRIESDMAIHRYKQSGGPARDNQDRAVKLEQQWSEAARLGMGVANV